MTNKEIAEIFRDLALISEFIGENPFKVNAYRNAYKIISDLECPIGEIISSGEKLKGIGEIITKKIEEILSTGKLNKHAELMRTVPEELVSMLRESEISPRVLRKLHDSLDVKSWDNLRDAYFSGKLTTIGIGASSIKKIENALKKKGLI